MSFPKFTAESSLGNSSNHSGISTKPKYGYEKSISIEPAMQGECHDWNCGQSNGYTEKCKVPCWIDGVRRMCDGTREVEIDTCYCIDENGWVYSRTYTNRGRCEAEIG